MIAYLGHVERHCPLLPLRPNQTRGPIVASGADVGQSLASFRTDLNGLLSLMRDNPNNYRFMRERISRMWPRWLDAIHSLENKQLLLKRKRKRVCH